MHCSMYCFQSIVTNLTSLLLDQSREESEKASGSFDKGKAKTAKETNINEPANPNSPSK